MNQSESPQLTRRNPTVLTLVVLVLLAGPTTASTGSVADGSPAEWHEECASVNVHATAADKCVITLAVGWCSDGVVVRVVVGSLYSDCVDERLPCLSNGTSTIVIRGSGNSLCVTNTDVCSGNDFLEVVIIGDGNRVCEGVGTVCSFNLVISFVVVGANNRFCNSYVSAPFEVVA